jgi:hypothetical protein
MKTFKQLREALSFGKPTFKAAGKKSDVTSKNTEAPALEPRADNGDTDEKKLKDLHAVKKTDHPEKVDVNFTGGTKQTVHQTMNGEREKVKQGSTDVGMKSQNPSGGMKQTPVGRENPKGPYGDVKPVVTSPSAVKPITTSTPRAAFKSFRESVDEIDEARDVEEAHALNNPALTKQMRVRANPAWVDTSRHSWGRMLTVHHGQSHSYPLHPEHQSKIRDLRDGQTATFRDETGQTVTAKREGPHVVLTGSRVGATKTTIPHYHFSENY